MRYNLTCEAIAFVEANPAIFKGNAKVSRELREKLYLYYNEVFKDSKRPNGCGACQRNVIDGLYKVYLKHKDDIQCKKKSKATQTGRKASQPTQTADQKEPKTKRTPKSGKRTKS